MNWIKASGLILILLLVASCAGLKTQRRPALPEREIEDLMAAIVLQGRHLQGLQARGSLQLSVNGQTHPRVKALLRWVQASGGIRLRLTALGPLGATVFDCLADGKTLYLYIPSRNAVYIETYGTLGRAGKGLGALAQAATWVLNPWSAALTQGARLAACPAGLIDPKGPEGPLVCLRFPTPSFEGFMVIDPTTLAANVLRLPKVTAQYHAYRALCDGSPYPGRLTVTTRKPKLRLVVDLEQIQPDSPTAADQAFSPAFFRKLPARPLDELFPKVEPYARDHKRIFHDETLPR